MMRVLDPSNTEAHSSSGVHNVLTIAGSDPSGGAGMQGDLRAFAALEVYGCAVPTALTVQNTRGVFQILAVPGEFVSRQLEVLLDDVEMAAVKIGMLNTADVVRAVVRTLRRYAPPNVVLDPVLRSSTGQALIEHDALDVLRNELLPLVDVVTPNAAESGILLGCEPPRTAAEAANIADAIRRLGPQAALVTGGHLEDNAHCTDVLATAHGGQTFQTRRVAGGTHGTGCALAAAIAAYLARGLEVSDACALAQQFVARAVTEGARLTVGRGIAPVFATASIAGNFRIPAP